MGIEQSSRKMLAVLVSLIGLLATAALAASLITGPASATDVLASWGMTQHAAPDTGK